MRAMDRSKKIISDYVDKQYQGDYSKVIIVKLDYANIQTPNDLLKWAENTFDLKILGKDACNAKQVVNCVYDALAKQRTNNYAIVELNKRKISSEMKDIVGNFRTAISFHLFRDYGKRIDFL